MHTPQLLSALSSASLEASLTEARLLLAEIERADGASPVSDQAMIAAEQGTRELFLVRLGDVTAGVGVVGEGELDLALLPAHRAPEVEAAAFKLLLDRIPGDVRSWVHGDRPATSAALAAAGAARVGGVGWVVH